MVSQIVRLVVRDEFAQRDRFMRENLDAMAQKVGEMQAKLVKLEAMGDRVSGPGRRQAGGTAPASAAARGRFVGGQGGPFVPPQAATLEQLDSIVDSLDEAADAEHRPVHADRVAPARGAPAVADDAEQRAGRRAGRLGLRLPHRPVHRPRGAAHRAGLPGRRRHADPGRGRRRGAAHRALTPPTATWSRSTMATAWSPAMRMPPRCWCKRRRPRQARPGDRRRSAAPAARPARTCTSRCWSTACRRTRPSSWPAARRRWPLPAKAGRTRR